MFFFNINTLKRTSIFSEELNALKLVSLHAFNDRTDSKRVDGQVRRIEDWFT